MSFSQTLTEQIPPPYIQTVIFSTDALTNNMPIIERNQTLRLSFDDLRGNEATYYYQVVRAEADWSPTKLFESEYLDGFNDLRIRNMENAYGTLQSYTHYQLEIPNADTNIKLSGNYLLIISNREGDVVFSKKFLVAENKVAVGVSVHRLRELSEIDRKQRLELQVPLTGLNIRQPEKEMSVFVVQNQQWNTLKKIHRFDYNINQILQYMYAPELVFEGGNEYHYFDTKDLRSSGGNVAYVLRENLYQSILYPNYIRNGLVYTYAPDINGSYVVQTLNGTQPDTEADYTQVVFGLRAKPSFPEIHYYVSGNFNYNQPQKQHKLNYVESLGYYSLTLPLKQGVYNYKFKFKDQNNQWVENGVSGSHWETENDYTALVYVRQFGERFDRLVGVGYGNSNKISD
ncbi:MAG: DUF5103 domain-containing protein [Flavobacteriaceae bacterium]|nr:DUF5103 domain-containing protein [Flavobacteriaceae bacterium]